MSAKNNPLESLTAWMENVEGASLEELRELRRELGDDVEGSEREFITMLRGKLGRGEKTADAAEPGAAAPLEGLLGTCNRLGLLPAQVADAAGLSLTLLAKLDRRLISYGSVPREVINRLARSLRCGAGQVSEYLSGGGPQFVAGAQYKASSAPVLPNQQNFAEAVRSDRTLSPDRKAELLALSAEDE